MPRIFKPAELPHLHSTRDTRDRMDLVTDAVPVGAWQIRADRILYHPGDTAAPHYHADCHHLFYVLRGAGILNVDDRSIQLDEGMVAAVGPAEVHWFENPTESEFSFVEFWSPPPTQTVWITDDV